jgi:hypothetical protein
MTGDYGGRPPGYIAAIWAHLMAILALPFFGLWMLYLIWGVTFSGFEPYYIPTQEEFEAGASFEGVAFRYIRAAVAMAPLATYLIYSFQRRKIEENREYEWARFQTMQALLFQVFLLIIWFTMHPRWNLGGFDIGLSIFGIVVALIVYAIIGGIGVAVGWHEFSYPFIGRLARRIVAGRYRKQ